MPYPIPSSFLLALENLLASSGSSTPKDGAVTPSLSPFLMKRGTIMAVAFGARIIKPVAYEGAMGILSDRDIMESLMTGYIGISDFSERGLTPNGYDLRIAEISVRGDPEIKREGTVTIPPRTMFYVSTIERVRMASDICAQLWLRTTWIRKGVIGAFGKIDAGFEGTLTLGAYNATDDPVEIPIGERFCQMVMETLNSETIKDYSQRSGNYQGQTGVTLDPLKK